MTYRIRIAPDAALDGIAIQIARPAGDGHTLALRFTRDDEMLRPHTALPGPSLQLDDDLGRALLDALAEHYGNTSGGRQQRADYEHERARVDLLIGALIDRAGGSA